MATPGRKLPEHDRNYIQRTARQVSIRQTAKLAGVSRNTVRKYVRNRVEK